MVKLRLTRFGAKKNAFYRIIATDSRNARDSRWLEQLGTYNPNLEPHVVSVDLARVDYWLSKGALPTATMHAMIKKARRAATATATA